MLDLSLFLGFSPDALFQEKLKQTNAYLTQFLIGKEEYLQEVTHLDTYYLGKSLHSFPTIQELIDLDKHLKSLLSRLVPDYSFSTNPPVLLTLANI